MLITDYKNFLNGTLTPRTINIYAGRLQTFLDSGYSENDLIGAVDILITKHSAGGVNYNPKDSGNTVAALRKLKDYILAPYVKQFSLSYNMGYSSWVDQSRHVHSYAIADFAITIDYHTGHFPSKTVTKKLSKKQFYALIDIFREYQAHLSLSDTAMKTIHGYGTAYSYFLDDNHFGDHCAELFKDTPRGQRAFAEYEAWIGQYI